MRKKEGRKEGVEGRVGEGSRRGRGGTKGEGVREGAIRQLGSH